MAMEKILQVAVEAKLNPEDIPDLIVFSDMQFDVARSSATSWETHHERIVRRFKEEGLKICGKEWSAPQIVYWNLRGNTSGFPAQADRDGVTMLSRYSPSLLKLLLDRQPMEIEEEGEIMEEDGAIRKKKKKNPFSSVRMALDREDYDMVRNILYHADEGILTKYIRKEEEHDEIIKDAKAVVNSEKDWKMVS